MEALGADAYHNMLESIYYIIYILGIPIVAFEALRKQRQYLRLAKERTYIEVNDKYIEFLSLAIAHPRLSVTEFSQEGETLNLSQEERIQQNVLYDMLTSIFERAFFLHEADTNNSSAEWSTWDHWISVYVAKDSYREFLKRYALYGCFGESFQDYLKKKIKARKHEQLASQLNPTGGD